MDYRSLNTEGLRSQRANLAKQATDNAESFRATGNNEALSTHSRITRDVEQIDAELHRRGQFFDDNAPGGRPLPIGHISGRGSGAGREDTAGAWEGFGGSGHDGGERAEVRNALFALLTDPASARRDDFYGSVLKRASLSTASGAVGGYLVPVDIMKIVEQDVLPFDSVRQAGAQIKPVMGRENIPVVSDPTAVYQSEADAITAMTAADPTFAEVTIRPSLLSANTAYSWHVQAFSPADVEQEIIASFGRAIGKAAAAKFLTGNGTDQPQGLVVGAGTGVAAAATTTFTTGELDTLWTSLAPEFQQDATWIVSPGAATIMRTLETSGGFPLWLQSLAQGAQQLYGRPVVVDANMPAVTAGLSPIVLASVKNSYVIAESPIFLIVDPYSLATKAQNRVVAYQFSDGRVKRAVAAKKMVMDDGL